MDAETAQKKIRPTLVKSQNGASFYKYHFILKVPIKFGLGQ